LHLNLPLLSAYALLSLHFSVSLRNVALAQTNEAFFIKRTAHFQRNCLG